jgi:hypothetical protein
MCRSLLRTWRPHLTLTVSLSLAVGVGLASAATIPAGAEGARVETAGVYVLTRAGGRPLPYPFRADLGAGEMTGDLTGARLTLRPDGRYQADLVVRVDPGILASLPGVPAEGVVQTVHDHGRYAVRDDRIVLEPVGPLTRRYDARLSGRWNDSTIALTEADVRAKGERYRLALDLRRVR